MVWIFAISENNSLQSPWASLRFTMSPEGEINAGAIRDERPAMAGFWAGVLSWMVYLISPTAVGAPGRLCMMRSSLLPVYSLTSQYSRRWGVSGQFFITYVDDRYFSHLTITHFSQDITVKWHSGCIAVVKLWNRVLSINFSTTDLCTVIICSGLK